MIRKKRKKRKKRALRQRLEACVCLLDLLTKHPQACISLVQGEGYRCRGRVTDAGGGLQMWAWCRRGSKSSQHRAHCMSRTEYVCFCQRSGHLPPHFFVLFSLRCPLIRVGMGFKLGTASQGTETQGQKGRVEIEWDRT